MLGEPATGFPVTLGEPATGFPSRVVGTLRELADVLTEARSNGIS